MEIGFQEERRKFSRNRLFVRTKHRAQELMDKRRKSSEKRRKPCHVLFRLVCCCLIWRGLWDHHRLQSTEVTTRLHIFYWFLFGFGHKIDSPQSWRGKRAPPFWPWKCQRLGKIITPPERTNLDSECKLTFWSAKTQTLKILFRANHEACKNNNNVVRLQAWTRGKILQSVFVEPLDRVENNSLTSVLRWWPSLVARKLNCEVKLLSTQSYSVARCRLELSQDSRPLRILLL